MSDLTVDPSAAEREPATYTVQLRSSPHTDTRVQQPHAWYFTFGHGQTHPVTGEDLLGAYVVIHGTATAAREQMVAAFGTAWCDQYSSAEGAGVERFALRRIELPQPPVCDASCCAGREVPWPDALNPHLPQPGYTPRPYGQGPEPEHRTVSLELATDELRELAVRLARSDIRQEMAAAKVVVVLRFGGQPVAVPDTDVPWATGPAGEPVKALRGLLSEMIRGKNQLERDEKVPVELLMPTPDVLAALDGRPTAGFWSAPVPVTARHVQKGWLVVGYSGDGMEERVEEKDPECGAADCPWPGDCTQLTIGDDKPQHFADWTTLTVRLPCRVTR